MEIFASGEFNDEQAARLKQIAGNDSIHIHGCFDMDTPRVPAFEQCEVMFGNPPAYWLADNDALRWIQLESVGFGEYAELNWPALNTRLTVTNLAGFFSQAVAESVLAGILALYRGIDRLVGLQRDGIWQGDAIRPTLSTLQGKSVVLFGYGEINRCLADLLRPFRVRIIPFGSDWTDVQLDGALSTADVVVAIAPDTRKSRGAFNAGRLALMHDGALFVNFGRGSVVEEDALADALCAGRLGGAVVDVTRDEPLPVDHRFWTCPNMILTQHSGGGTADEIDRKINVFEANLMRYRRGEQLTGVVDFSRGY